MLRLDALTVSGYKSFARPTTVKLRPLTLLYGRNNAGKSALLRLLPILAASVADDASAPLVLSGGAGRDAHYREILWRAQTHRRLVLKLHWASDTGPVATDAFTLDYVDDRDQVIVRRLEVTGPDGALLVAAEAQPQEAGGLAYEVSTGGQAVMRPLELVGLTPSADPDVPLLAEVADRLRSLRSSVQWLESVRARPERLVKAPGARRHALSPDGREAGEVLVNAPDVYREVQDWYRAEVDRDLEISSSASALHYRIMLDPRTGPARQIDIADTGEGMAQVLPVLVAAALARRAKQQTYLAVEEPESHLHPNAQRSLALHLARIAASDRPPIVVTETHSRILLLGVQVAIAQGVLATDRVCAYWVDAEEDGSSQALLVEFDAQGQPRNWPSSAFAEDRALARELLRYQLQSAS